jgi:hypothetical protein
MSRRKLTVCQTCDYPHCGPSCTNPACYANPLVSNATKTAWAIRDRLMTTEAIERDRMSRIRGNCFGVMS